MARNHIEQLVKFEQRSKETARHGADATKRAEATVNAVKMEAVAKMTAVKTDADAKMVALRSEHAAKLGELSATRQRLAQHEQQTDALQRSSREVAQTLGGAQKESAVYRERCEQEE